MKTLQLKTVSTLDAVREMLEKDIYSLYFPPGSKITENDLSVRYGVSRNTLREAISYLVINGLLIRIPNKGIFVKEISVEDISEIFHLREVLESEAIRELVRSGMIPSSLRHSAEHVQAVYSTQDWYESIKADVSFHEQLVHLTDNQRLIKLYDCLLAEVKSCIYQSHSFSSIRPENAEHHMLILESMENGNLDMALKTLNKHINSAIQDYSAGFSAHGMKENENV